MRLAVNELFIGKVYVNLKSMYFLYLILALCIAHVGVGPAIGATDRGVVLGTNALVIVEAVAGHPQDRARWRRSCTATEIAYGRILAAWAFTLA